MIASTVVAILSLFAWVAPLSVALPLPAIKFERADERLIRRQPSPGACYSCFRPDPDTRPVMPRPTPLPTEPPPLYNEAYPMTLPPHDEAPPRSPSPHTPGVPPGTLSPHTHGVPPGTLSPHTHGVPPGTLSPHTDATSRSTSRISGSSSLPSYHREGAPPNYTHLRPTAEHYADIADFDLSQSTRHRPEP